MLDSPCAGNQVRRTNGRHICNIQDIAAWAAHCSEGCGLPIGWVEPRIPALGPTKATSLLRRSQLFLLDAHSMHGILPLSHYENAAILVCWRQEGRSCGLQIFAVTSSFLVASRSCLLGWLWVTQHHVQPCPPHDRVFAAFQNLQHHLVALTLSSKCECLVIQCSTWRWLALPSTRRLSTTFHQRMSGSGLTSVSTRGAKIMVKFCSSLGYWPTQDG